MDILNILDWSKRFSVELYFVIYIGFFIKENFDILYQQNQGFLINPSWVQDNSKESL